MNSHRFIVIGTLMEVAYLSFYFVDESPSEVLLFIAVNGLAFVLLTYLLFRKPSTQTSDAELSTSQHKLKATFIILGFAIVFRVTLVGHAPIGSDDIYRYIWDGKVAAYGINPFRYAPTDSALALLHTDELPAKINFPTMRTIYPPLAQVLFFVSHSVFGDSIAGLKLLLILADIASVIILLLILVRTNSIRPESRDAAFIVYAWSPLPIMYFGLDGHIDAFGIPFLLLFLVFAARNKHVAAAIALGFGGLAKLYPLMVAPILLRIAKGWQKFLLPMIPASMMLVGCWFSWEPTAGLIESFKVFSSHFEFNGSVFHLVYSFVGKNQQAHLICAVMFLVWLGIVAFVNRAVLEKTFLAFVGFVIFAPVVQPWYLTWLAALLALRWSTAIFVLLGLSNLSNLVVYQYRTSGVWEDNMFLLVVEYLPFYALLVWEVVKGKFGNSSRSFQALQS